jgi:hypothetical protein
MTGRFGILRVTGKVCRQWRMFGLPQGRPPTANNFNADGLQQHDDVALYHD